MGPSYSPLNGFKQPPCIAGPIHLTRSMRYLIFVEPSISNQAETFNIVIQIVVAIVVVSIDARPVRNVNSEVMGSWFLHIPQQCNCMAVAHFVPCQNSRLTSGDFQTPRERRLRFEAKSSILMTSISAKVRTNSMIA